MIPKPATESTEDTRKFCGAVGTVVKQRNLECGGSTPPFTAGYASSADDTEGHGPTRIGAAPRSHHQSGVEPPHLVVAPGRAVISVAKQF